MILHRRFLAFARRYRWHLATGLLALQLGSACPTPDASNITGNGAAPSAPSGLSATPSSATQINLAWTDNSNNEDGFRIERAPGGTTTFTEIGTVASGVTAYQNTGLTGSTAYTYRVRAYNATGNSAYSATADATTMLAAPTAPSNLLASGASSSQVNITWTDNSNNEDGFRIEVTTTGATGFSEIATVGAGVTTYQHTGLTASTGYTYRVRSYNAAGNSTYSNSAVGFTAAAPVTPPAAPSNLAASGVGPNTISLTWTDNSSDESGFRIERAPGGTTSFVEIVAVNAGQTTYLNAGLTAATQYTYRVRAYNSAGNSAYTATATATTTGGGSPPTAPSALGATAASSTQINLAWTDNSNNEDGFKIERAPGTTSTFAEIATVGAGVTTYQNTGLTASTQYTYRVRAYNSTGNSAYSATATATTSAPPPTPPAAPSGLGATAASATQINLAWTDNSSDEDGFKIERAPGTTSTFTEIASVGAGVTAYQNTSLAASTQYTYRVLAYNAAGNSGYSGTATATTTAAPAPPAAPSGLGATAISTSKINLAWTDNANNEDGFRIERCQGASCSGFAEVAVLGPNASAWQDSLLSASTSYSYRVRTYNGAGNSGYSATATATTNSAGSPPAAPSGLSAAAASSAQINLTWTDNSNNEDGFKIERCTGAACSSFVEIAAVAAGVDNYQSTGLTEGTTYGFRVRAYNGLGNSLYSNTASATTDTPLPTLPTNLVATAASASQINLTWNDNSTNETGFRIERCTGAACSSFAEITTVGAGVTAYQNTGLSASTLYRYRVRAYNLGGNSAYSDPAEATTQSGLTLPTDPSALGATAFSSTQINLTWTDNSNNEDGFRIERCSGVSCSSFAEITTVGAGVTTYQNTGLTASTSYSYRVRAYNAAGNSGYTSTATAVTPVAPPGAPSGLTATAVSDVQINLAWVDNASNETEFRVEMAVGGGGFTDIGSVGANVTSTPVSGLTTGTTYSFRVRANNAGGYSAYSNTATKTTWLAIFATADNLLMRASANGTETNERNTNYPSAEFSVGCNAPSGSSGEYCTMTALQWTGLQSLIAGKTIASAYLRVYPYSLAVNRSDSHAVNAFASTWSSTGAGGITWANEPNIYTDTQSQLPVPQAYGAMDFNITTIVQNWASGARTNAGLLVRDLGLEAVGSLRQTTYNGLDINAGAQYRPMLIIIFP